MSRDPAGYADPRNLYQYVLSRPVRGIDPFGLKKVGEENWNVTDTTSMGAYWGLGGDVSVKVKLANYDCCNPKTGSRKFEGYYTLSAECTISGGVGVGGQIDLPGMGGIELQWRWLRGELRRTYSGTLDTCVKDSLILKDESKAGINIGMDFMAGLGGYIGVTPVSDIAGYLEYEAEAHVFSKWVKISLGFSGTLKVGLQFDYFWYEGFWPVDPEFDGTSRDLPIFSHTFSL